MDQELESRAGIAAVDAAISGRRSIRAFLPTPVPKEEIERILEVAARAPSGTNTQPWQVHVITGQTKAKLVEKLVQAHNQPRQSATVEEEYAYYPRQWESPYIERRRKVGWDLYTLLGLARDNKVGMHQQHGRNFCFFDAPVGLMFTIDRIMEQGSWLDYGMFLQNIMVAARARGLDTCPQAAFINFAPIIKDVLQIPATQMLVCGMSLGYADLSKIENSLQTERVPVSQFTQFHD